MALKFPCEQCKVILQISEEFQNQQVRCSKCSAVNRVPSANAVPEAKRLPETEEDVPEGRLIDWDGKPRETVTTEKTSPRAAVPPAPKRSRGWQEGLEEPDRDERPRRRRPEPERERSSSALPLILLGVGGLVLFFGLVAVGGVGYLFWARSPKPVVRNNVPIGAPPPHIPLEERLGPPGFRDRDKGHPGPGPGPDFFPNKDGGPPGGQFPPPQKEKPFVPAPTVAVKFTDGKYESRISFDGVQADPERKQFTRSYRFDGTAGKVYWVRLGDANDRDRLNFTLRIDAPDGVVPMPDNRFENRGQIAFEAKKTGPHTVFASAWGANFACNLMIRELRPGDALPPELQLRAADSAFPKVAELQKLNVYDKQFTSATFSVDGKCFYLAHSTGTLAYYTDPADTPKGTHKIGGLMFEMCVDSKGRVYAQHSAGMKGRHGPRDKRIIGDIGIWEKLRPNGDGGSLPKADKTLNVRGIVTRMVASRDGKWIYFLDTHNRKLGRIDTEKQVIDKEIDTISGNAKSLCVTPDGKKVYCCSSANQLYVIDAATFKLEKTVTLDTGNPVDVAATDKGLVYLATPGVGKAGGMLVDLTAGVPDKATCIKLPITHLGEVVRVMPDQKSVLYSADRGLIICTVPARPGVDMITSKEMYRWDYFLPGQTAISPDGRTVLLELGRILSVSR